jgi:hypothetical protein
MTLSIMDLITTLSISIQCHYAEVVMLSVEILYCYPEGRCAGCHYAECRYAECRGTVSFVPCPKTHLLTTT